MFDELEVDAKPTSARASKAKADAEAWRTKVFWLLAVNTIMVAVMFGTLVYGFVRMKQFQHEFANAPKIDMRQLQQDFARDMQKVQNDLKKVDWPKVK